MAHDAEYPNNRFWSEYLESARVFVACGEEIESELPRVRALGLGVEVQTFAQPAVLSAEHGARLKAVRNALDENPGPVGFHGAFIDTVHYSLDAEVRAVALRRYQQSLEYAAELGAEFVVFHSQYNPLVRLPSYPDLYHEQSMQVWPGLLEKADVLGLNVYIENMFDDSPSPLANLMRELDHPRLGVCLDMAHIYLFSQEPLSAWTQALGSYVTHAHLSDTDGQYDDHLPLGHGVLDVEEFLRLRESLPRLSSYTLEHDKLQWAETSLAYLGYSA